MVSLATGGKRHAQYAINKTMNKTKITLTKQTNKNSVGTCASNESPPTCVFL